MARPSCCCVATHLIESLALLKALYACSAPDSLRAAPCSAQSLLPEQDANLASNNPDGDIVQLMQITNKHFSSFPQLLIDSEIFPGRALEVDHRTESRDLWTLGAALRTRSPPVFAALPRAKEEEEEGERTSGRSSTEGRSQNGPIVSFPLRLPRSTEHISLCPNFLEVIGLFQLVSIDAPNAHSQLSPDLQRNACRSSNRGKQHPKRAHLSNRHRTAQPQQNNEGQCYGCACERPERGGKDTGPYCKLKTNRRTGV